jgi:hypothetical protein
MADAMVYERGVRHSHRASAPENGRRFLLGVVSPKTAASNAVTADESAVQTECLLERRGTGRARLEVRLRFLQLQPPIAAGASHQDDVIEHEVDVPRIDPVLLLDAEERLVIALGDLEGTVTVAAVAGGDLIRIRVRLENTGAPIEVPQVRADTLRRSFICAHFVLAATHASFVAALDSKPERSAAVASCVNERLSPVPVGEPTSRDLMVALPISLPGYEEISRARRRAADVSPDELDPPSPEPSEADWTEV